MAAPLPPPAPALGALPIKKAVITQTKTYTKSILILSGQYFPYAEWCEDKKKEFKKVWLTSSEVFKEMGPGDKKLYDVVKGFDNFATNSLVEYTANQCVLIFHSQSDFFRLNKEHHFTHVR